MKKGWVIYLDKASLKITPPEILIVGVGGIGSNLVDLLIPALETCELKSNIYLMDSDVVEKKNLGHQKFFEKDIGKSKAESIVQRFKNQKNVNLFGIPEDLRHPPQLENYDIVVVCVDRPGPRKLVHKNTKQWLDIRCMGDAFIALDSSMEEEEVTNLTPDHKPQSRQFSNAISNQNLQFGFVMAAAFAAQWVFQKIRSHHDLVSFAPPSRIISITFGELNTKLFGGQ